MAVDRSNEDVQAYRAEVWTYSFQKQYIKYFFTFIAPNEWKMSPALVAGADIDAVRGLIEVRGGFDVEDIALIDAELETVPAAEPPVVLGIGIRVEKERRPAEVAAVERIVAGAVDVPGRGQRRAGHGLHDRANRQALGENVAAVEFEHEGSVGRERAVDRVQVFVPLELPQVVRALAVRVVAAVFAGVGQAGIVAFQATPCRR